MSDDATSQVVAVVVDCADPERVAGFWRHALGSREVERWTDALGAEYVELRGNGPTLLFQPVREPKVGKNRLHLDIACNERSQREEVLRLVALGATVIDEAAEHPWIVLADPAGNEFCVLAPRT